MRHIWSPWRMKYITQHVRQDGCIFCNALQEKEGPQNLIAASEKNAFIILNRYPYTNGHVMVVPYQHKPELAELDAETRAEMIEIISRLKKVLDDLYHPEGVNIGANVGAAAGAGVAGHVHFHIVPRWRGDSNFMTTVGETRVSPEDLAVTYERSRASWATGSY